MEFQIHDSTNGQYYWTIVAANKRTLATSENYYNKADARSAAQSVKTYATGAPIVDKTRSASASRW
jgi:uncharacterized protein YegP (UPF0339 family)